MKLLRSWSIGLVSQTQADATAIDTITEGLFSTKLPLLKGTSGFPSSRKKIILLLDIGILLPPIALFLLSSLVHPTGALWSAFPHLPQKYDTHNKSRCSLTATATHRCDLCRQGQNQEALSLRAFTSIVLLRLQRTSLLIEWVFLNVACRIDCLFARFSYYAFIIKGG